VRFSKLGDFPAGPAVLGCLVSSNARTNSPQKFSIQYWVTQGMQAADTDGNPSDYRSSMC